MSAADHALDHPSMHMVRDLASSVAGALWEFEPIRTTKSMIVVDAGADGVVKLSGNVRSDMLKSVAGRLAGRVAGVRRVDNMLVTDAEIEARVAGLLGHAESVLYTDRLNVESRLGTVYLDGVIASADRVAADAALAEVLGRIQGLPGVNDVIHRVQVVEASETGVAVAAVETPAAGGAEMAEMQERLSVWRERAAAKAR
jgi:osmotically-inducible protein OsmY